MRKGEATRERILDSAVDLIERRGYVGTGMNEILAASGAPRGSLYFHFPGGKEELVAAAVERAAGELGELLAAALSASDDVVAAGRIAVLGLADRLEASSWEKGCPVATVSLEAEGRSEALRQVCERGYRSWEDIIRVRLERAGFAGPQAESTACVLLSAVEGALVLARAYRSRQPLERLASALPALLSPG